MVLTHETPLNLGGCCSTVDSLTGASKPPTCILPCNKIFWEKSQHIPFTGHDLPERSVEGVPQLLMCDCGWHRRGREPLLYVAKKWEGAVKSVWCDAADPAATQIKENCRAGSQKPIALSLLRQNSSWPNNPYYYLIAGLVGKRMQWTMHLHIQHNGNQNPTDNFISKAASMQSYSCSSFRCIALCLW